MLTITYQKIKGSPGTTKSCVSPIYVKLNTGKKQQDEYLNLNVEESLKEIENANGEAKADTNAKEKLDLSGAEHDGQMLEENEVEDGEVNAEMNAQEMLGMNGVENGEVNEAEIGEVNGVENGEANA